MHSNFSLSKLSKSLPTGDMFSLPSIEDKLWWQASAFPGSSPESLQGEKELFLSKAWVLLACPLHLGPCCLPSWRRCQFQCSKGAPLSVAGRKGTCRVFTLISLRDGLPVCFRGTLPPQDCTWASETILGVIWHSEWGWGLFWEKQCLNPGHLRFRGIFKMTCKPSFLSTTRLCFCVSQFQKHFIFISRKLIFN